MMRCLLLFICILLGACKVQQPSKSATPASTLNGGIPGAVSVSCSIKGRIVSIQPPAGRDTSSACARYSCLANIAVLEVMGCGSAVGRQMMEGDIVSVRFVYTLAPTQKAFPDVKEHYPGLKSGDVFIASVAQRPALEGQTSFLVYGYSKL